MVTAILCTRMQEEYPEPARGRIEEHYTYLESELEHLPQGMVICPPIAFIKMVLNALM